MAGVVRPARLVLVLLGAVAFLVLLLLLTSKTANAAESVGGTVPLPGSAGPATGLVADTAQALDSAVQPGVPAVEVPGVDTPTVPEVEPLLDAPAPEPFGQPQRVVDTVTEAVGTVGLDGPLVDAVGDVANDAGALLPPPPDVALSPDVPLPPDVAVAGEPSETGRPVTMTATELSIGGGPGTAGDALAPVGSRESAAGSTLSAVLTARLRIQPLSRGDVTLSIGGEPYPGRGSSPGDSPASELRAPPWAPSSTTERRITDELFAVVVLTIAFLVLMAWNRVRFYPLVRSSWVGLTSARPG